MVSTGHWNSKIKRPPECLLTLRANFSYAHNEIIENDTPLPKYDYLDSRGHPIDQPFGLIALGLD